MGCDSSNENQIANYQELPPVPSTPLTQASEPILPIPEAKGLDPAKVSLGKRLFSDPIISGTNKISCASCHILEQGGADVTPLSIRYSGELTKRNTPTIYNVGLNGTLFWDGRTPNLEKQILTPRDTNTLWPEVLDKLSRHNFYSRQFEKTYPDGLTIANIQHALVTYQRSLVTPHSRFDRYLRGEKNILSKDEQEGYLLFKSLGCIACHQGVNVGGNLLQKFGVLKPLDKDDSLAKDPGRYRHTKNQEDFQIFRVPSLRNVALTAPYFHDGSIASLTEAVSLMAKHQLGRDISESQIAAIVAFLKTLTGQHPNFNTRSVFEKPGNNNND